MDIQIFSRLYELAGVVLTTRIIELDFGWGFVSIDVYRVQFG